MQRGGITAVCVVIALVVRRTWAEELCAPVRITSPPPSPTRGPSIHLGICNDVD